MKRLLEIVLRRHRPDVVAISALLDGRLDAGAAASLESHAAACATCRTRLAELRDARDALRAMRTADAPRSFRLTAAMAASEPAARQPTARSMRWAPALAGAAALVFAVLVGADLFASGTSRSSDSSARSPAIQRQAGPSGVTAPDASDADKGLDTQPETASSGAPPPGVAPPDATAVADAARAEATATARSLAAPDAAGGTTNDGNSGTATTGESAPAYDSASRQDDGNGGRNFWSPLRVIEAAVAAVALAAGAIAVGANLRRRGAIE